MSTKTDAFENALLDYLFNDVSLGLTGSLYLSAHTADPGEAGDQTTNEVDTADYTNYARVAVDRTTLVDWVVTGDTVALGADTSFAEGVSGDNATITHIGIGTAASGAGLLMYYKAVDVSQTVTDGVAPFVDTNTTVTEA